MRRPVAGRWALCAVIWGLAAWLLFTPGSLEPSAGLPIPDKLAHGLAWLGMSGSLFLALAAPQATRSLRSRALAAFGVSLAWGVISELIQAGIPRRSADPADVLADAVGALAGVGLALAFERWRGSPRGARG